MLLRLIPAFFLFALSSNAFATIEIKFQTDVAEQVLADVCSNEAINETDIRNSDAIQNMLAHFAQFRDYFTLDAYIEARQQAAFCQKAERDIFRFNELIDRKQELLTEVQQFSRQSTDISDQISAMLRPYTPRNLDYSGNATIMVGTPSCGGWSVGPDFYVDLPCISNDPNGLQYLIAHESYHGIQDAFIPKPVEDDWLGKLLSETLREGSATAIADFSTIDGGQYTQLSQSALKKNARRLHDNYALLDMAAGYLRSHPNETAYASVNNIGLSGQFDAPFYSVGANIVQAIEKQYGRDVLVCLLAKSPEHIFALYGALSDGRSEMPSLGPDLAALIAEKKAKASISECLGVDRSGD